MAIAIYMSCCALTAILFIDRMVLRSTDQRREFFQYTIHVAIRHTSVISRARPFLATHTKNESGFRDYTPCKAVATAAIIALANCFILQSHDAPMHIYIVFKGYNYS